jgi:hypothetical protein
LRRPLPRVSAQAMTTGVCLGASDIADHSSCNPYSAASWAEKASRMESCPCQKAAAHAHFVTSPAHCDQRSPYLITKGRFAAHQLRLLIKLQCFHASVFMGWWHQSDGQRLLHMLRHITPNVTHDELRGNIVIAQNQIIQTFVQCHWTIRVCLGKPNFLAHIVIFHIIAFIPRI